MIEIGHIVQWERALGRSFASFDGTDRRHVTALLWAMSGKRVPLDVFAEAAERSQSVDLRAASADLRREFAFVDQFRGEARHDGGGTSQTITQVVGALIMQGVGGAWLMRQGLEQLVWLCEAAQAKSRRDMETGRYWARVMLAPYTDGSKVRTLHDFLPFEWDGEHAHNTEITEREAAIGRALFGNNKQ